MHKTSLADFELLKLIGKGSYAKVMLTRNKKDGRICALKVMKKKHIQLKKQTEHIIAERNIMAEIEHPFIVQLKSSFQTSDKLYLALQYCPGGELFGLLRKRKRLTEDQTKFYAAQVVLALEYLHGKNIIYRDLKPQNVLIDEQGYIKLTDFGLSKEDCEKQESYSICGTPDYLAPEILYKEGHGKAVDWWCLGCFIFELLTGLPPFYSQNRDGQFDKIKFSQPNYPHWISPQLKSILQGLLDKRQHFRLGYEGAADVKSHPWFEKMAWDELLRKNIKPPFIPMLKSEEDVSYFDSEYTQADVDSEGQSPKSPGSNPFKGMKSANIDFSFDKESPLELASREIVEFEMQIQSEEPQSKPA